MQILTKLINSLKMAENFDRSSLTTRNLEARKSHRRLVHKNGKSEIIRNNSKYSYDKPHLVHTLIDAEWKWTLMVFITTFIFTWFLFGVLWMALGVANGDNEEPASINCLIGIQNFSGYLLFSIETQTSVGYGTRSITQNCFEAIILVCIQILIGIGLGGSMISIVYAKMISPKTQHADRCFTKNAVICQRDGELCLIFKTRDPSKKYSFQNTIKAFLITLKNGESLLKSIELEKIGMILWPSEIVHKITKNSPFWDLSAKDLVSKRFEIIVIMEGTSLSTNQSSRTVTSYLSNEILWGNTFKSCVKYDVSKKSYRVSHKRFNVTNEVATPLCSAQRLSEVYREFWSPLEYSRNESVSPESGIVMEPIEEYESSEFSSSDDEEEEKIGKFQIRKKSVVIMSSLLDSLQKYVKNNTSAPLETPL